MIPLRGAPACRGRIGAALRGCSLAAGLLLATGVPAQSAPDSVYLEDLTWTELRDAVHAGRTTLLVPVGGTEQSGPAIALGKHNVRVRLLAGRIAAELGNAIVAPVLAYVPEGAVTPPTSHMRFPGTITVPDEVFERTLEYAARSLRAHGARDIFFLGDHGGYQRNLAQVARRLDREWHAGGVRVHALAEYFQAGESGYARLLRERGYRDDEIGTHAALADTSLMLALDPALVRTERLRPGVVLDATVGVYGGDPRRASADLGRLGVEEIVRRSVAAIRGEVAARGTYREP